MSNETIRLSNLSKRETSRLTIISAILSDKTGHIPLTWFNQNYVYDKLSDGMILLVIGKVKFDSYSGMPTMNQITSFTILDYGEKSDLSGNCFTQSKFFPRGNEKSFGKNAAAYRNFATNFDE